MSKERIDKLTASRLGISRRDAHALIKCGKVFVNDVRVRQKDEKADPVTDSITVNGKSLDSEQFVYIMLNKPAGIVSASRSENERTVVDLVPDEMRRKGLFPAGRLDKDTTGLVIITNDGEFAHNILSPAHHVTKTYLAGIEGIADEQTVSAFANGMTARNGEVFKPAGLKILKRGEDSCLCEVKISEGRYHQVKRMFAACGLYVATLHRTAIGGLQLPESLKPGECVRLTSDELQLIQKKS